MTMTTYTVPQGRITPENITQLLPHQVFGFGSNEGGQHSKGAALTAKGWGACRAVPAGRAGQTYAIPTKPADVRTRLTLRDISKYVEDFITHAQENPQDEFLMTAIGCGLAGYRAGQIAPLFRQCVTMPNLRLPASFWVALGYSVTR